MKSEKDLDNRHNSVGNASLNEKNVKQLRNFSLSNQDVFRTPHMAPNDAARLRDPYITGVHPKRRVSSLESVQVKLIS